MNTHEFVSASNPEKAKRMLANIRARYARGLEALEAERANPAMNTRRFAETRSVPDQQIRRDKQFAQIFSESELEQACQLRQPDGMPLQWGHLSKVFALPKRKERLAWLKKATKHGWPADVFSRQIAGARRQGGRHGRGIKPPSSVEDGLNQLARDGELWLRRLKVVVHFINEQTGGDSSPKDLAVALNTLVESRSKKDRQELLKELRPLIEQLADVMGRMRQSCTATTNRTFQRMLAKTK